MTQQNHVISIPKVVGYDTQRNTSNQTQLDDETLVSTEFFPAVSLLAVRNTMRIDGTVTNERLKHSVISAIGIVNRDLKAYCTQAQANGKQTLAECNDEQINGVSLDVHNYLRAVYCLTAANLYERYRSYDSTKDGNDKADELESTADDLKRDYHFAVRDILGGNHLISELI
ncbi:head completion/stabilization protein [Actinobacillus equuli]|uniref:head completion/stabilization protein n=1 Tax=Actinobacillus equuli TaxID=718 RepID=UPI0024425C58|nr:head completion/stabilization protein [Actinobacillus equuli]WGE76093.1 head completion/stabilization protein [Actinobacillus equuli subsp. haemolyticus]WGE78036.1 head completion/stabilization protein [Actinobacillus equuli subsp. haemolyticus]